MCRGSVVFLLFFSEEERHMGGFQVNDIQPWGEHDQNDATDYAPVVKMDKDLFKDTLG